MRGTEVEEVWYAMNQMIIEKASGLCFIALELF